MDMVKDFHIGYSYHMQVDIPFARWFTKEHPESGCISQGNHELSDKETLNYLNRLAKDGFKYVPSCTNIDSTGKCLGHKES